MSRAVSVCSKRQIVGHAFLLLHIVSHFLLTLDILTHSCTHTHATNITMYAY